MEIYNIMVMVSQPRGIGTPFCDWCTVNSASGNLRRTCSMNGAGSSLKKTISRRSVVLSAGKSPIVYEIGLAECRDW